MFDTLQEHLDFHYASDTEADNAEASFIGSMYPERAWISTDRDVWHANPYYTGLPKPHPEDDSAIEEYERDPIAWGLKERERRISRRDEARIKFQQELEDEIPF